METVNTLDPVVIKLIGSAVFCWLSGYMTGKVFRFVTDIFKRASRTS